MLFIGIAQTEDGKRISTQHDMEKLHYITLHKKYITLNFLVRSINNNNEKLNVFLYAGYLVLVKETQLLY